MPYDKPVTSFFSFIDDWKQKNGATNGQRKFYPHNNVTRWWGFSVSTARIGQGVFCGIEKSGR